MKLSNQSINKSIKILLFFLFIVNTAAALWTPIFSIFILDHIVGATLSIIGLTSAIYSVVRSVLQIPIAKYLDSRAGEKTDFNVIFTGIVLAIVCSFAFLVVKEVWQLGVIQIFWGVADACTMAAYYSIFSHHIDRKSAAFEWSLYSVGGITIAVAIGGLIGGFVAQYFGFSSIFIAAGSLNVLALILLGVLKPHMKIMREVKAQHLGKIIIGLTGTHGSGKGEVVEYLKEKGFVHYSAREFIYKEIDKRNLPRNRDSLNQVSNDLRSQFGPEYVAFSLYEQACKVDKPSIIESIYTIAEIEKIKQAADSRGERFVLIAVDADPKIRYERVTHTRKAETDHLSFERFLEQQKREMESDDPKKHNFLACKKRADIILTNNGSLEEFHGAIERSLKRYIR